MTIAEVRVPRAWMSIGASLVLLAAPACRGPLDRPAPIARGPLPTRVMQPVALIVPGPQPRTARVLERGRARASLDVWYASIFETRGGGGAAASFDGEIARAGLRLAYGVGGGSEIVLAPTATFATGGLLDRFVDEFHRATGFEGGGREIAERDQYSMRVDKDGVSAFEIPEDEVLFNDLPVSWVRSLRREDEHGPALATRVTLEFPTGDESRGTGSGGIDAAVGLLLERSVGRWTFTGGLDGVFVDQPDAFREAGIEIKKLLLASGGVEYRWSDRLSLLGQAVFQSPLTRDLPFEEIDREILDLGFGIARDLGRGTRLVVSFHEDAVAASGPDVTFYAGLSSAW